MLKNKSFMTNALSLLLLFIGYISNQHIILYCGLFAFSGALTNWLAIYMLFEKVPGLYGSGVIPARFEAFKAAIKALMMEQFFTEQNISRFLNQDENQAATLDMQPIISKIDFAPTFDSLLDVIMNSSFGGMITMMGGPEAMQPLREPFIAKMKESVIDISQQDNFKTALKQQLIKPETLHDIESKIEEIIDQRLNELTPKMVKEMVQKMISEHLGWLVIWGGVFGGIIGIISALITG
ncbi:DUF445 domain-containing protein [Photobacterium phosphoreum]|uniref:DUF445 domain-containing protein n=1 Tax=Photobacterium phosphoreum TaxID=659 RepID=UPI000D160FAA|nr:DUF445 domain-containing protein [Photobacterium phosphoreum]MCD9462881.1 DUF445 domain-containing protein [Photobacterium phosphoreum]MCD9470166.1 DUF445 domain-containing protein [Photobacterium phosphoreum]MCD9480652.1 DUF445 domain-containing protein [Photobacterium phosphoreum]MCD9485158.1 DUF445 domain-containing protein [Photobacterium phosphoreum]MCD9508257.1 DUF445 domain-containing protein [Photobacterium phosphoreum]